MNKNNRFSITLLVGVCALAIPVFGKNRTDKAAVYWRKMETPGMVRSLLQKSEEQVWVGTSKGLFEFSLSDQKFTRVEGAGDDLFTNLAAAKNGNLFAMGMKQGLLLSTDSGKSWRSVLQENYDPIHVQFVAVGGKNQVIAAALEDEDGNGMADVTELYSTHDIASQESWKLVNKLPVAIKDLAIKEDGKMVVLTPNGPYVSEDGGSNFTQLDIWPKMNNNEYSESHTQMYRTNATDYFLSKGRLWAMGRDIVHLDWTNAANFLDRKVLSPVHSSLGTRKFVANQRGEVFLFEKAAPFNQFAEGMPPSNASMLVDLNAEKSVVWECEEEEGCDARFNEVYGLISNQDRTNHLVATEEGLYRVGVKKFYRLTLNIEGAGEVVVYNESTGMVQPYHSSIVLEANQFGADFDKVTLSAEPKNKNWQFKGWVGTGIKDPNEVETKFELGTDLAVTAKFEKVKP